MLLRNASAVRSVLSLLAVAGIYGLTLWRNIKDNRGNRVIECGSIALIVFFLLMVLMKFPTLPDWVLASLGSRLLLLCVLTMLFLLLQGVHVLRNRKSAVVALHHLGGEQPAPARLFASFMSRWLSVFLPLFVLFFLWLHFVGPRRQVGYWITHEPLSAIGSAIIALLWHWH
jgi:hypothetical protein